MCRLDKTLVAGDDATFATTTFLSTVSQDDADVDSASKRQRQQSKSG